MSVNKEVAGEKIYGNSSFSVTEPELRSLVKPCGPAKSATLATDRDAVNHRTVSPP